MYTVRRAAPQDIPILVDFRERMFRSLVNEPLDYDEVNRSTVRYLKEAIEKDQFVAWVAETEAGEVIGCSAVSFYELPPKPWNMEGRYAYVSSMFTEDAHRRKGLGTMLLQAALDYAKNMGTSEVSLHASRDGESLYSSFGFRHTNEMKLRFDDHSE